MGSRFYEFKKLEAPKEILVGIVIHVKRKYPIYLRHMSNKK
jgi:hypothetical protein